MDSPKEKEEFYRPANYYIEAEMLQARLLLLPRIFTVAPEEDVMDVIIDSEFSAEEDKL